ncbi:retention module-containing protein, partial [Pseudoalteromonas sp. Z9A5]|uniref:retention module-containing protein n=1 Tax=Pseudoalteromonas sp. Z9A5 TaxID=2686355 RepID=UPI0014088805
MEANQLVIIDIQGSAGVVQGDGSIKALNVGDIINVGDLVVTAIKSSLTIDVQGESLSIPANQKVKITQDLLAKEGRDLSETTFFDESIDDAIASLSATPEKNAEADSSSDVSDFLDALAGEGDLLSSLEATAAGGSSSSGVGGGNSFVQLTRISESFDFNSISFDSGFERSTNNSFNEDDAADEIISDEVTSDFSAGSISLSEVGITNSSQPLITGTSENLIGKTARITVTDAAGNSQVVTVVINLNGTFETTLPNPIIDGPVTVLVEATDFAGNSVSDGISLEIDATAPLIIINPIADSAFQIVTVTGFVSGSPAGSNVTVTLTDSTGEVQVVDTQVDAQGNWAVTTSSPLAEGEFNVSAVVTDTAGNEAIAQEIANIDLTAPVITVNVVDESNNTTPLLTGTTSGVPEGTEVTISVTDNAGEVQTLTAITGSDGSWSVIISAPLSEGAFNVDALVSDSVGNQALASDAGIIDLTVPVVTIDNINDTQNTTPLITGNVQGVPAGSIISVVITDINNQIQTLLTQTNTDGDWSVEVTTSLPEGLFEVVATVNDAAGNQGRDDTQGIVDLTPPDISITAITDTNDVTPTFVGRVEGAPAGTAITVLVTDSDGNSQTLTTLLDGNGSWSVEVNTDIPGGIFTAIASVSDLAGNEGSAQIDGEVTFSPASIQIDSIANSNDTTPFLSGNTDNISTGTTVVLTITASDGSTFSLLAVTQADGSWSAQVSEPLPEGDFTVAVAIVDNSGNEAQASIVGNIDLTVSINFIIDTSDTTPSISGTTQDIAPNSLVTVTFTGNNGATETVQVVTDANGAWSIEASSELVEGQFSVVAIVTDAAGNTASASEVGEIDLTAPEIIISLADSNDTTPLITGSVTGEGAGTTVTLTVTDASNTVQTITTETLADGSFSVGVTDALAEGDYTLEITVVDAAGNTNTVSTTGTVDTEVPV